MIHSPTFAVKLPCIKRANGGLIAFVVFALCIVRVFCAHGASSAHYSNTSDQIGSAGSLSNSANYTGVDSVGNVVGDWGSTIRYINKHDFIGQLYDVVGLEVLAEPGMVGEGAERQLVGKPVLDDGTTFALLASDVNWNVVSGPVTGITAAGLASAGTVFADTTAVVQGQWRAFTDTFPLQVQNVSRDDFGSYAGDGLEDDWQVQFFGLNNPEAAPGLDPDGDGQNNRLEFLAGVGPTDPNSTFRWRVETVPDSAGIKRLHFSPVLVDRVYTIQYTENLGAPFIEWLSLNPGINDVTDANGERVVIDSASAAKARRHYRVQLSKP